MLPVPAQEIQPAFAELMTEVRACNICQGLPLGPRPILQAYSQARILIAGQAPGSRTHAKGIPFDDPSGDRLRDWLGIDRETFYDNERIAIIPMGFCFPGTGSGGDLPPRPECAQSWRDKILSRLTGIELTLVIGRYAIDWHLPELSKATVTEAVKAGSETEDGTLVLPHPSPRNNRWLRQNPWFEEEVLPKLKQNVENMLN